MTHVFLDTNILMDVLLEREPFFAAAIRVWTLCEGGLIQGSISVISFNNVYYVVRKHKSKEEAQRSLRGLRDIFTPVTLDGQVINQAIDSGLRDFEDAIQFCGALRAGAKFLITRNVQDFPESGEIVVLTPEEFLAAYEARQKAGA
jgi:predicted nucleic acid-binding protein